MLDLVLGGLLVVLAIRGWMRGLVKEVISLAVLVVGTVASFRLSTPLGRWLAEATGISPDAARIVSGLFIFFLIATGAAVISRVAHLGMRVLPGVSSLNRAAGAALSLIAFALVVTLAVSIASVAPLPEALADEVAASSVADAVTEPDGVPQRVLGYLSGDRVVAVTLLIRELTGGAQAVATAGQPIAVTPTAAANLERLPDAEKAVVDLLNRERVAAGASSLPRSSGLDQAALDLAMEGYGTGTVPLLDDEELRLRLNAAGLPSVARSELVVLTASPEAGHAALVANREAAMLPSELSRVGVAVVQGGTGLLIVSLMTG